MRRPVRAEAIQRLLATTPVIFVRARSIGRIEYSKSVIHPTPSPRQSETVRSLGPLNEAREGHEQGKSVSWPVDGRSLQLSGQAEARCAEPLEDRIERRALRRGESCDGDVRERRAEAASGGKRGERRQRDEAQETMERRRSGVAPDSSTTTASRLSKSSARPDAARMRASSRSAEKRARAETGSSPRGIVVESDSSAAATARANALHSASPSPTRKPAIGERQPVWSQRATSRASPRAIASRSDDVCGPTTATETR